MLSYDVWLKQITIPADLGDVPKPEDQPADRLYDNLIPPG